ncbi:MAG: Coenzyme F420 hydrogenase/dehydrogenase, beta subunit C-terminal domain [Lachnospiraceae bacterium]|nr:Coenzyme F420 hydrogenase/dehydrogenase, beta subunit C-terminal domain [Lachnospiraceae bacterium]
MKKMSILCKSTECTGCTACMAICPVDAIEMKYNEQGFLYPSVDEMKCIYCGACNLVVQKLDHHMEEETHKEPPIHYYAARLCDETERMRSQSGGLFYALASMIIQSGGLVYGCAYLENFHVGHTVAATMEELQKMRGSKYVQSDMRNCYRQIEQNLKAGKEVLFSGTPCQCAGIEAYLEQKRVSKDKFYSCDIICHGVPSPGIFEQYLKLMEAKYQGKLERVNLRDKAAASWHNPIEKLVFDNNTVYQGTLFGELFYSNLAQRMCCQTCKYTTINRPSDITIGDCWGIEKIHPELWNDETGISVALIQTKKGEKLFERAMSYLDVIELPSYTQPQLENPAVVPKQKERFWRDYQKLSFECLLKKYTSYGGIRLKIKRKLLRIMNKW